MLRAAATIVSLVAVSAVAAVLLTVETSGRLHNNHGDPVYERPLTLRQDGRSVPLRSVECWVCPAPVNDRGFDPSRPFRILFSSTTTVGLEAGVHRDGRFVRVGRWERGQQCIDSRCLHAVRFTGRRFPRSADILRIRVNGVAADIRVAPKV